MELPEIPNGTAWFHVPSMSKEIIIANNTFVFSSGYFQEFFRAFEHFRYRKAGQCEQYICPAQWAESWHLHPFESIAPYGSNIYNKGDRIVLHADNTSPVYFAGNNQGNLAYIQAQGMGWHRLPTGSAILMDDRPCPTANWQPFTRASRNMYVNSIVRTRQWPGQYHRLALTTTASSLTRQPDTTDGYDGINRYSNEVFSSAAQYSMPSDQTLWCCLYGPRTGTGWLCST